MWSPWKKQPIRSVSSPPVTVSSPVSVAAPPVAKAVVKPVKPPASGPKKPTPISGSKWISQPVDGELARVIRRGIRAKRREKGRQGHRFRYDDLRVLLSLERRDETHIVASHHEDKLYQYWRFDPENGWMLESWFKTQKEAQAEAENSKLRVRSKPEPKLEPGTYLHAAWSHEPYHGTKPMTVKCSSPYTAEVLSTIFGHLGCAVEKKDVA